MSQFVDMRPIPLRGYFLAIRLPNLIPRQRRLEVPTVQAAGSSRQDHPADAATNLRRSDDGLGRPRYAGCGFDLAALAGFNEGPLA